MLRSRKFAILCFIVATLGKLMPHPPNVTPINNLCILAGIKLSRWMALITMLIAIVISDFALSYLYRQPMFGYWSIFNYSAYVIMILLSFKFAQSPTKTRLFLYVGSLSFGFWLWTNFGIWLTNSLYYPKTIAGLFSCYTAALPFLRNSLIGDAIWLVIIFGLYNFLDDSNEATSEKEFISRWVNWRSI